MVAHWFSGRLLKLIIICHSVTQSVPYVGIELLRQLKIRIPFLPNLLAVVQGHHCPAYNDQDETSHRVVVKMSEINPKIGLLL